MNNAWNYPWYAAWDRSFEAVSLAEVDIASAKRQLDLLLRDAGVHPGGEIPACQSNLQDVHPPTHAWAVHYVYTTEEKLRGQGDVLWLDSAFQRLLLNFVQWVNVEDPRREMLKDDWVDANNTGLPGRSKQAPTGGYLGQAGGDPWIALFSQNMLQIALELCRHDPSYEDLAVEFVEHFLRIAGAMNRVGDFDEGMWDDEDGFYYDLLHTPEGKAEHLKVRSLVGLLPLCATTVIQPKQLRELPRLVACIDGICERNAEIATSVAPLVPGVNGRRLLSALDEPKLRRVLARLLDEREFLNPYGIRALSRYHLEHPYAFTAHGEECQVEYVPAECNSAMFRGHSNWRGAVWVPMNLLILQALLDLHSYYGDRLTVECPTGSGRWMNLLEAGREMGDRLARIFLPDENGRRAIYGGAPRFQIEPYWSEYLHFYEYFHSEHGAGKEAVHQAGWAIGAAGRSQWHGDSVPKELIEPRARSRGSHQ